MASSFVRETWITGNDSASSRERKFNADEYGPLTLELRSGSCGGGC